MRAPDFAHEGTFLRGAHADVVPGLLLPCDRRLAKRFDGKPLEAFEALSILDRFGASPDVGGNRRNRYEAVREGVREDGEGTSRTIAFEERRQALFAESLPNAPGHMSEEHAARHRRGEGRKGMNLHAIAGHRATSALFKGGNGVEALRHVFSVDRDVRKADLPVAA